MEPFDRLALVLRVLGAEPEDPGAELPQLRMVVPERAGLRRAPPGAGDLVPPRQSVPVRPPGVGIEVDHRPPRQRREVDLPPRRRGERDRGEPEAREMIAGAVVLRDGEVDGKGVEVVGAGHEGANYNDWRCPRPTGAGRSARVSMPGAPCAVPIPERGLTLFRAGITSEQESP